MPKRKEVSRLNNELLKKALSGDELAISKVLTNIEYTTSDGLKYLQELTKLSGKAHTIGVTGIPGAGKSTLLSDLIETYVSKGFRVGVIMIDPSSPISMGSFMGNRIRMQDKTLLSNVFIRSTASRGHLGGFSSEALMLMEAMDGLGFDRILVETVGAGQTDTDVMSSVHSVVVLTIPGAGDEIQALKAGIMEIGDIYVVNKADRPEADMVYDAVRFAVESGEMSWRDGWKPLVLKVSALKKVGIGELVDALEIHSEFLKKKGLFETRVNSRRRKMIELILRRKVNEVVTRVLESNSAYISEMLVKGELATLIDSLYSSVKDEL